MVYGLNEMLKRGELSAESRILAIHTGGLQGVPDYNQILKRKNRTTLSYAADL
jgi:1-aminocyclopropane-1-carboxylate deaminase